VNIFLENLLLVKEILDCDISIAFNSFIVNKILESWLTEKAEVEPRVGGKYELFWDPSNRKINSTIGCKVTGIEKNRYISFNWKGPVQFQSSMNVSDPLTQVIIFFFRNIKNSNKTDIYLFHTGWRNNLEWQKARDYFKNAWLSAFQRLKNNIKTNIQS
jgi:uncharacterized protein YndB with AHSA1/START domain